MGYTNANIERDIGLSKFYGLNNSIQIEKVISKKGLLPNYLTTGYTAIDSNKLQYIGKSIFPSYPLSMIEEDIKKVLKSKLGYDILEVNVSELLDDEEKFTVLTMELTLNNPDYSKIIDEEYELSEELGLYEKNIILRLV